jgi:hypothetical protein
MNQKTIINGYLSIMEAENRKQALINWLSGVKEESLLLELEALMNRATKELPQSEKDALDKQFELLDDGKLERKSWVLVRQGLLNGK